MTYETARKAYLLSDISRFSRCVLKMPLYDYQVRPLTAVIDSVLTAAGASICWSSAARAARMKRSPTCWFTCLNLYQRKGGSMVFAATGDGLGRGQSTPAWSG